MDGRRIHPSLAFAGALAPVWLVGMSAIFGSVRLGYDPTHAISELGQQGADNAVLWNATGFGGMATLIALFAFALRATIGDGWPFRLMLAQALFVVGGASFSCDPGCPPMMATWQGWGHTVFGLAFFATASVTPLVMWRTLRSREGWTDVATWSLVIGLVLLALFVAGPFVFGAERVGIYQRVSLATLAVANAVLGARCWRVLHGGASAAARAAGGQIMSAR